MRGHRSLFVARQKGYKATDVWLLCYPSKPSYTYTADPENLLKHNYLPEIHIYPSDNLLIADLRCIYDLNVHVDDNFTDVDIMAIKRFTPKAIYLPDGTKHD